MQEFTIHADLRRVFHALCMPILCRIVSPTGWCVVLDEVDRVTEMSERLPFRVRIAAADELDAVARLRATAYGRHLPALAAHLRQPEAADYELGR